MAENSCLDITLVPSRSYQEPSPSFPPNAEGQAPMQRKAVPTLPCGPVPVLTSIRTRREHLLGYLISLPRGPLVQNPPERKLLSPTGTLDCLCPFESAPSPHPGLDKLAPSGLSQAPDGSVPVPALPSQNASVAQSRAKPFLSQCTVYSPTLLGSRHGVGANS